MPFKDQHFREVTFMAPGQQFEGCTFERCRLNLDEIVIEKCRFSHCLIFYSGRPVSIDGLRGTNCVFAPQADLLRGLQTMASMFGVDDLVRIIRDLISAETSKLN